MIFYKALSQLDKNKNNIVITIVSGNNIGSKLLLSDGEIIYTSNNEVEWESVIKVIPKDKKVN